MVKVQYPITMEEFSDVVRKDLYVPQNLCFEDDENLMQE